MHECQRYNGLVMRGLYRPSYHFITSLIGFARGSLIYADTTQRWVVGPWPDCLGGTVAQFGIGWARGPIWVGSWPDLGGTVARFGWARGPIWVGLWPDLGGLVARFWWARGPRFGMMCVPTPTGAAPGRKRTSPAHPQDRTALLGLYWTAIRVIRLVPTPNTISIS